MEKKKIKKVTKADLHVEKTKIVRTPKAQGYDWKMRHEQAMGRVLVPTLAKSNEAAMVAMIKGWVAYAEAVKSTTEGEFLVGQYGVLGPHWESIGYALKGLLDGEIGRLDGGILCSLILDTLKANGCEVEE